MTTSATADNPSTEAPAGGKKKKLLIIVIGLCVVLAAGGGAAWYFLHGNRHSKGKEAVKEEHKAAPVFVNLESFTVNLQDDGGERYLQTEIVLQVSGNEMVEPIKEQMPILRSSILLLLSSKVAADITTKAGKNKLAEQIIEELRRKLGPVKSGKGVDSIHFASFVIQ